MLVVILTILKQLRIKLQVVQEKFESIIFIQIMIDKKLLVSDRR